MAPNRFDDFTYTSAKSATETLSAASGIMVLNPLNDHLQTKRNLLLLNSSISSPVKGFTSEDVYFYTRVFFFADFT